MKCEDLAAEAAAIGDSLSAALDAIGRAQAVLGHGLTITAKPCRSCAVVGCWPLEVCSSCKPVPVVLTMAEAVALVSASEQGRADPALKPALMEIRAAARAFSGPLFG